MEKLYIAVSLFAVCCAAPVFCAQGIPDVRGAEMASRTPTQHQMQSESTGSATLYMFQESYARQGSGNVAAARLDLLNCMAGFLARGDGNEYIFLYGGTGSSEPQYRWATTLANCYGARLDYSYDASSQYWPLVNRLKTKMPSAQFIRYDYNVPCSSRWAMSIAGIEGYLACDASLASEAQTKAGLTEKESFTEGWTEQQVWQRYSANPAANRDLLLENFTDWPAKDYRTCYLNDLAVALKSWVFWDGDRGEPRSTYLGWLNSNARHMGVSAGDEGERISEMSVRGVRTVPADWSWNLATMKQFATRKPRTPLRMKPLTPRDITWEDKVTYCTFVVTDGDNLQVLEGPWCFDSRWYSNAHRGSFALGWQLPPCMTEYAPIIFESLVDPLSAIAGTPKDCFVAGLSGDGVFFVGAPSDTSHAFGAATSAGTTLIDKHAAGLNTQMKQQAINVLTGFVWDHTAWLNYDFANYTAALERPLGILVDTYTGSYTDGRGELKWARDRDGRDVPVKSADYALWDSPEGKTSITLAAALNAVPHAGAPVPGSFIHVATHAWSWMNAPYTGIIDEAYKTTSLLAPHMRVVRPDEFFMQMRFRLHTNDELIRYHASLSSKIAELDGIDGKGTVEATNALSQAKATLAQAQAVLVSAPPQAFNLLQTAERQTEIARLSFVEIQPAPDVLNIFCPDSAAPLYHFTARECNPQALPVISYRIQVSNTPSFSSVTQDVVVTESSIAPVSDDSYVRVQATGDHGDVGYWSGVFHVKAACAAAWAFYN